MSGSHPSADIQQIPARHGTATFVPKGHVIKIINTYGRQVVDTWAFALPKDAPSQQEVDEQNEQEEEAQNVAEKAENEQKTREQGDQGDAQVGAAEGEGEKEGKEPEQQQEQTGEQVDEKAGESSEHQKPADDKDNKGDEEGSKDDGGAQKVPGSETETDGEKAQDAAAGAAKESPAKDTSAKETPKKAGWGSYTQYIPSIRRSGGKEAADSGEASKAAKKKPAKQQQGEKRTWASYFPSGQGFSNYVPSKSSLNVSAFASSHYRDTTKSYAEQLYDFSKTPVGAGALSAASGSGYAGTAYAAWKAYASAVDESNKNPPMEYLSMPHTHVATSHLIPRVSDTLVSNLRQPLLTVLEDTAAHHDTVIAACDPHRYKQLGVDKWEEHGSCAENLVLALKELNEKAGLKGNKAIGTDVTVNTVPQPLNLFMNVPWGKEGDEAGTLSFEAPKGKKGEFVRLKAERDVVVVMSACPQDITPTNGGKCMAAHFVVQEPEGAPKKKPAGTASARPSPKKLPSSSAKKVPQAAKQQQPTATNGTPKPTARKPSQANASSAGSDAGARRGSEVKPQPAPKPGRAKPKKLERKTPSQAGSAK